MHFFNPEEGYYSLTNLGSTIFILLAVVLVIAVSLITSKSRAKESKAPMSTVQLAYTGMALALAYALSYVKLWRMPWGGSVTLCSMLFVVLVGYWYGAGAGITAGLAYSILQFLQGGDYILSLWQVMFDYILAFTALGLSGFFSKKKNGLIIGYLVAITARCAFHAIGGYLYWMDYMPDNFPKSLTAVYPILYNLAYIGVEGVITVIVLLLPPVKNALKRITAEIQK